MKKLIIGMAIAACFFTACKNNSGSSSASASDSTATALKKNKQTALNSEMGYGKKDISVIFKDYAPDFTEYGNGTSKPEHNLDSIKANTTKLLAAFPDYNGGNLHAFADSNMVIVTADWTGTFKNQFMSMQPTGKTFKVTDADFFTFNKDGKITSHKSVQSDFAYLHELGVPIETKSN